MKALFMILLMAGVIQSTPTLAESSSAATSPPSPLLGRWAVDVSRLPIPPEARPKSVTISFSDAGSGKWTTRVDIVDANGSESIATATHDLEGTPAHGEGNFAEADTAAAKSPKPDVLIMALGKGGVPASTRIYAVAANGKHMIETAVYFGHDGMPVMRTNYFNRVR